MARHRNIRNINLAEEVDDDDDYYSYGQSIEDEASISPGMAQFMYKRQPLTFAINESNTNNVGTFNDADYAADDDGCRTFTEIVNNQKLTTVNEGSDSKIKESDSFPLFTIDDVYSESAENAANHSSLPTAEDQVQSFEPAVIGTPVRFAYADASDESKNSNRQMLNEDIIRNSAVEKNVSLEQLRLNSKSRKKSSQQAPVMTPSSSCHRLVALTQNATTPNLQLKVRHRPSGGKCLISLVVVGHVDAGKSTLMGHLLYKLGEIDQRQMHKHQTEAQRCGKASFAYAWVLDETAEERDRGVTMDIAHNSFETQSKRVSLIDAPGHKDFIPNMITGAAQADAGLLVVNATRGEFETGFDQGGQTREHAILLRSLGVAQLAVAVNKLDTIDWSKQRYDEICQTLSSFLQKQTGFVRVTYVPVSGLDGINLLSKPFASHPLAVWYDGPTLIDVIDSFSEPDRTDDKPLRLVISDVFKGVTGGISLGGKVESGTIQTGDKVIIMPNGDSVQIKNVQSDENAVDGVCFSGDQCLLTLTEKLEVTSLGPGHVICQTDNHPLIPATKYRVKLVLFNLLVPLTRASQCELHAHNICEPCIISKLIAVISKATGQVVKKYPRCLTKNMTAIVVVETERMICLEPYSVCKALGRLTLRSHGQTIAAGIVERVV